LSQKLLQKDSEESRESIRKDFLRSIRFSYNELICANRYNAFNKIFEILLNRKLYEAYKDNKNPDYKSLKPYIDSICIILDVYKISKEDIKKEWKEFLRYYDIQKDSIAYKKDTMRSTYEEFIKNKCIYGEKYFDTVMDIAFKEYCENWSDD
jgi:hypothetical protein